MIPHRALIDRAKQSRKAHSPVVLRPRISTVEVE
jgi:hypothetical protein